MRPCYLGVLESSLGLLAAGGAWGQAGRYVPVPRAPSGGGGLHFLPHLLHGRVGSEAVWVLVAVVMVVAAAILGWRLGYRLSARRPPGAKPTGAGARSNPPLDLILSPYDVQPRAHQTGQLLWYLARRDPIFNPSQLRAWVEGIFRDVQRCWENRDYKPVHHVLLPEIRARHELLLQLMRQNHEINRIENLEVQRLEFVHLMCPEATDRQEVTALITFAATVSFVDDRTGAYRRGYQQGLFQEFWIFRRQSDRWRLLDIERSHESSCLQRPLRIAGLSEAELRNVENNVIAL